ncbi:MAG: hypothetical protein QM784_37490 [Polyangiaceae bacterium]
MVTLVRAHPTRTGGTSIALLEVAALRCTNQRRHAKVRSAAPNKPNPNGADEVRAGVPFPAPPWNLGDAAPA